MLVLVGRLNLYKLMCGPLSLVIGPGLNSWKIGMMPSLFPVFLSFEIVDLV